MDVSQLIAFANTDRALQILEHMSSAPDTFPQFVLPDHLVEAMKASGPNLDFDFDDAEEESIEIVELSDADVAFDEDGEDTYKPEPTIALRDGDYEVADAAEKTAEEVLLTDPRSTNREFLNAIMRTVLTDEQDTIRIGANRAA